MPKKKKGRISKKKSIPKKESISVKIPEKKSSPKLDIEEILEEFDEPLSRVLIRGTSPSLRQINDSPEILEFEKPEERHQEKKPEIGLYTEKKSDYSENPTKEKKEYETTPPKTTTTTHVSESGSLSLRPVTPINSEINQLEQKEKDYSVDGGKRLERDEPNLPFSVRKDYDFS